jgi:hypothetical protein
MVIKGRLTSADLWALGPVTDVKSAAIVRENAKALVAEKRKKEATAEEREKAKQAKAVDARRMTPDLIKKLKEHPKGALGMTLTELQTILLAHNVEYTSGMNKADMAAKVDALGSNAAD